jgi:hypothetical protein
MFLNNSSTTRLPPSLLAGSDGTRSPVFKRYYEAAKTTERFLRRLVCCLAPQYPRSISGFRSPEQGNRCSAARVFVQPVYPLLFRCSLRPEDALGSPKFPANPSCIRPALRPRLGLHARLLAAFRCCPRALRRQRPQKDITHAAQSHGFCTRCLRFVPPSRTTTQNSLPVASQALPGGFSHPH